MAITNPIKKALGADVQSFPRTQQEKIVEMIAAINTLQEALDAALLLLPTEDQKAALDAATTADGDNAFATIGDLA